MPDLSVVGPGVPAFADAEPRAGPRCRCRARAGRSDFQESLSGSRFRSHVTFVAACRQCSNHAWVRSFWLAKHSTVKIAGAAVLDSEAEASLRIHPIRT